MTNVLITNDDGIDAPGIRVLASVAVAAGLTVTVAAPDSERSGASASLSALQADGRMIAAPRALEGLPDVRAFAVQASPAFIVMTGAQGAFGFIPDLVLSGVNHGPNTGHAILHSGTVGAAFTAYTHGIRAMAVSLASSQAVNWDTPAAVAAEALQWYLGQTMPDVLNVNVPDVPLDQLAGIRPAGLAALGAVQANIGEVGQGYVSVTFTEVADNGAPGTDVALLREKFATLTLMRAPVASPTFAPTLR